MRLDKEDIEMKLLKKAGMISKKYEACNTLRKHWNPAVVVTSFMDSARGQKVPKDELLPGELSAEIFQVGCYTVRSAQRIYTVCEPGYSPEQEIPASPEDVELVRKELPPINTDLPLGSTMTAGIGFQSWRSRLRVTHEISARHQNNPNGSFTVICRAAQSRNCTWHEMIWPILTAKEHIAVPNKQASLFVCNTYVGDSFSTETWYKLSPAGEITTLSLHPYDSDADKARFS